MNLTIRTAHLTLTDDLRAAVHDLVAEGLQTMGAPPDAEVHVTLTGPAHRGSHRHRAEAVVHAPDGVLRAAGHGLGTRMAAADLRQALLRQAAHWRSWHEGGRPATASRASMRGRRVAEPALRESGRFGGPAAHPSARVPRRPRG